MNEMTKTTMVKRVRVYFDLIVGHTLLKVRLLVILIYLMDNLIEKMVVLHL